MAINTSQYYKRCYYKPTTFNPGFQLNVWISNNDTQNMTKKTFPIGRDAETGILVPVKKAKSNPKRYIVESMPKRGRGDTK